MKKKCTILVFDKAIINAIALAILSSNKPEAVAMRKVYKEARKNAKGVKSPAARQ